MNKQLIILALKEIKFFKKFSYLFVFNIALGLLGLIVLENFKINFTDIMSLRAKSMLGSDISIESRFPLTSKEETKISDYLKKYEVKKSQKVVSLFSMAKTQDEKTQSRLVRLETLSKGFPFYGSMEFEEGGTRLLDQEPFKGKVWVYPELLLMFKIKKGDSISIAGENFEISSVIKHDSRQGLQMGNLAPKVYLNKEDSLKGQFTQKGSTVSYQWYLQLRNPFNSEGLKQLEDIIDNTSIKVMTPQKVGQQVGRVFIYLSDFLGLVGLVALFLSCIGTFYLYRTYLSEKKENVGVYRCLGLTQREVSALYFLQVIILASLGVFLGLIVSMFIFPLIANVVNGFLAQKLDLSLTFNAVFLAFAMGGGCITLLAYPLIQGLHKANPADLFQDMAEGQNNPSFGRWTQFLPWFIFFCSLTFFVSRSLKLGGFFILSFFSLSLMTFFLSYWLLGKADRVSDFFTLENKLSLKYLSRFRFSSISIFLSLSLATFLINLVPQINFNIRAELELDKKSQRPSLFLFDIQDDQLTQLNRFIKNKELELLTISPFIRSRLLSINGKDFTTQSDKKSLTREQQTEKRFRNRGVNLTFRNKLTKSERIVEGEKFPGRWDEDSNKTPLLSVEKRYAERLGLEIGDLIQFEIGGIPQNAKIHNIRSIRWTSFLPNFFIQFQEGVLDDAPKTWLAAVPPLTQAQKYSLQSELLNVFPNISSIDVDRVIERVIILMDYLANSLNIMSLLSLFVGLFVLYFLTYYQVQGRTKDLALLKILGLGPSRLIRMTIKEFFLIGLLASGVGALASMGVSFLVAQVFFDGVWKFWPELLVGSISLVSLLCLIVSYMASRSITKVSSQVLLS
jgi:putative ABC transport system permease protein